MDTADPGCGAVCWSVVAQDLLRWRCDFHGASSVVYWLNTHGSDWGEGPEACRDRGTAGARITDLAVVPTAPTDHDSNEVSIQTVYNDLCWTVQDCICGASNDSRTGADDFTLLRAVDGSGPGALCEDESARFAFQCNLGPLPPGHYSTEVRECVESRYVVQGDAD